MRLTNYWWLIIWMFTGGVILSFAFPRKHVIVLGEKKERWAIFPAIMLVLPLIIWAGFRGNFGDTSVYRENFRNAPNLSHLTEYLSQSEKDKGFRILTVLIKSVIGNSDVLYFLIIAGAQILIVSLVCRRLSCDYWLSIFIFIASTDYIGWVFNGIRQFLAATIIFSATELIVRKKYIISCLLILFASTMHASALLMLPIIFIIQGKAWNKKTLFCILISIVSLAFINQFSNILNNLLAESQYKNVVSDWKSFQDDGTHPLRVLVYAMPTIMGLWGYKYIKEVDEPLINLGVGTGIISTALGLISMGTSGIFLGRLPIYVSLWSNLIVLPWEIKHLFTKETAAVVRCLCIIFYIAFFYYQMHFTWGIM